MNNLKLRIGKVILGAILFPMLTSAQFDLGGQLVQRGEYRNGFGKLTTDNQTPAAFVSQRFRLQAKYNLNKVKLYTSVQDIRTWGNTGQIKLSDGLLSVHEAYAEIACDSAMSFKVGRQELNYDNARFLGNLDWALQARAHDFAMFKYERKAHKLHIGGGYNQDSEVLKGNFFTISPQYKTAGMVWYNYKDKKFELSFLFWNNGVQNADKGIKSGFNYRATQTVGLPTLKYSFFKNNTVSGFAYYQTGDLGATKLSAYDVSAQISQVVNINTEKKTSMKFTLGTEMLSGNDAKATDAKTNSYSYNPMYGTNHAHNGYMDYFYVGGRYVGSAGTINNAGLNDIFLRMRYDNAKKWFVQGDFHNFATNANVYDVKGNNLDKALGNEIDLSGGCVVNDDVSIQVGYSQMLASNTLKTIQASNVKTQNWAYIMLIIRPKSDKKFIGILNN